VGFFVARGFIYVAIASSSPALLRMSTPGQRQEDNWRLLAEHAQPGPAGCRSSGSP
jgi:hypothetical protein